MKAFTAEIRMLVDEATRPHFPHLSSGMFLQRGRTIGRVEGFTVVFRSAVEGAVNLYLGATLHAEPAVVIRAAVRGRGVMVWASAPQIVSERSMDEWTVPDSELQRNVLAAIANKPRPQSYRHDRDPEDDETLPVWNR